MTDGTKEAIRAVTITIIAVAVILLGLKVERAREVHRQRGQGLRRRTECAAPREAVQSPYRGS